ncbi:hypothetical protein CEXT_14711 [Caerostris extrusa]|uniref:Uncharacterized protein n=1 Tax=Caerostris extrusa TaxID=172846 RepID=A0AAV4Y7N8_CAEEX|nr:hypothetical protein CEXT_14711 [Caerostris extrusa]
MARSQSDAFNRERIPPERKEEESEVNEDRSGSDQEQKMKQEIPRDSSSNEVRDSPDNDSKQKQSFPIPSDHFTTLTNMENPLRFNKFISTDKSLDHHSNFHDDQPHIHHPGSSGHVHLRHGDHVYTNFHHSNSEHNNNDLEARSSSMNNHHEQSLHDNISLAHHHIRDNNQDDSHLNHIQHQYSVTDSEGVTHLINLPNHQSTMMHHNSQSLSPQDKSDHHRQTRDDENCDGHQMNHNFSPKDNQSNESHVHNLTLAAASEKNSSESQLVHQHVLHRQSMDTCNDINVDTHLVHLQQSGEPSIQDNNDVETHSSVLNHRQLLHSSSSLESDLQHINHDQDDTHHQVVSLLHDKDLSADIHHGDLSHRLSLDLTSASHNSSFPHIRSPASPQHFFAERLGYTNLSEFGRPLSSLNDSTDASVENLPLRSILATSSYLQPTSMVNQRDLVLDPNGLHAVSTPSITYHHLPDNGDSSVTPTSSPLFCSGVNTSSPSSKLLGLQAYGRSHDNNNVGSLMWSQVGDELVTKSSPLPLSMSGSSLLSRPNTSGHVSSYVSDLSTWPGYDNIPQNIQVQLAQL